LNKRQRQQLIQRIIKDRPVSTQQELVAALLRAGCEVTQATVSRDLVELGLHRGRDLEGRPQYSVAPSDNGRSDAPAACGRMLKDFGRGIEAAQNLLVLRCDPGAAPGLGRVLDELEHGSILGTVAGDDTVLLVCRDAQSAEDVCEYLRELGG